MDVLLLALLLAKNSPSLLAINKTTSNRQLFSDPDCIDLMYHWIVLQFQ